MQNAATGLLNSIKVFILGVACLITPKAIAESAPPVTANPTPTTILPSDPTLAEKRMEIRPFQVADSDSKEETQPAIATVESSSFNAQISSSASDLLPDEVKASGSITAQTESPPPEDSTTPDESNPTEPTEPADETPKKDAAATESVEDLAKKAQNPIANLTKTKKRK